MVVAGANNRMIGLLAGQLSAAMLDMTQQLKMEREAETRAQILVIFSQEFPDLRTTSHFARRGFIEQYPETVKDFIKAMLEARRRLQDPKVLADQFVKYLKMDPDAASSAAETYLAQNVWDLNGTYTLDTLQNNIDFLVESGELPSGLDAAKVSDLSALNAVLDEIGRK
jgi:ABC-type nitrate/sulfonate/bicarbonate transport system substrate-binding protein